MRRKLCTLFAAVGVRSYLLLALFASLAYAAARIRFKPWVSASIGALAASAAFQLFARITAGYVDPFWIVAFVVGFAIAFGCCLLFIMLEAIVRRDRRRPDC